MNVRSLEDRRGSDVERVSTEVPPPPFFRLPLASPSLISLLLLALAAHLSPAQTDTASAQEPPGEGPGEDEEEGGAFAQSGAVGASLSDAATLDGSAYLSGEPFDLSVNVEGYEFTHGATPSVFWVVWAKNHGGRDAHGVEVLLDRTNPENGKVYYKFRAANNPDRGDYYYNDIYGKVLDQSNLDYVALDSSAGVWRIGALPAGKRIGMGIKPQYEASGSNVPDGTTDPAFPARVVAQLSAEISNPRNRRDPNPENNRDSEWLVIQKTNINFGVLSAFNTLLEAKVGDLRPANNDGQAVDFTLRMDNPGFSIGAGVLSVPIYGLCPT